MAKTFTKKYLWLHMVGILLASVGIFSYFYVSLESVKPPRATNGEVDLSGWDFSSGAVVKLDGEWEFYWLQHLKPVDLNEANKAAMTGFFTVPDKWNNYKPEISPTGDGYATYRLRARIDKAGQYLAVKMPEVSTAYNLYINGQLKRSVGLAGHTSADTEPKYFPQVVCFYADSQEVEFVIQVSNFAHHKGGIKSSLQLGLQNAVYELRGKKLGFEVFLLGTFAIMAVYHFGLYMLRPKDKPALYFGLFCLLIAIRTIVTGEIIVMTLIPNFPWEWLMKIEYLSYYLSVPVFIWFIYHLYATDTSPKIPAVLTLVSLLLGGFVVMVSPKSFARTLLWYDVITIMSCLYVFRVLAKAVLSNKEGAVSFALGVVIFLATVVNDILFYMGIITTCEMVSIGLFVFIFFQALALSTRFSRAYTTLENLSNQLSNSNEKISHILKSITDGFFAIDNQARFTYLNKEAERLCRKTQEQLLGKVIWDEFSHSEVSLVYRHYQKITNDKNPAYFEIFWDRLGLWLEVNVYPSQDGLSVFVRDIQERKMAEKKIQDYTQMLKEQVRLLDLDPDYTIERSLDGVIVFWNHGAELGYKWTKEEALGKVVYKLLDTQFPQPLQEINQELISSGRWIGELIQTKRDGVKVDVRSCWLIKRDVNGNPVGVLEFNKDITEQKNIEKEMARLDRLNLIGQMAAGISHEVRNPMTTVRGFLQLLNRKETNAKFREYYDLMISELDRANDIITEYLSISKPQSGNFKLEDVNYILTSLEPLLQADAVKMGKEVILNLQQIPKVLLDGGEFRQLVLNLCRNGLEAMANAGKILTISTFIEGDKVVLSVRDQGPGISEEIAAKIGTPFLSTKDNGTGLGLAVCYGIAARHKADIEFCTGPEGTTFFIIFKMNSDCL
ncbi:7TM diverse intracellular signaling domain-containing protein [Dendrosporobacter sp. 1207_IL3150]|uniref:7TM diverse intracellular signaling domain-containing protein n=1 Tax=Dendrosporobacter sp. 1207_IL3150 TaxID=3084054 RepID=UPI002FD9717F